jgi:phenylacetic acid degradation operon negative regulatory protein
MTTNPSAREFLNGTGSTSELSQRHHYPPESETGTVSAESYGLEDGAQRISLAGSARSILLTILGELVGYNGEFVWTSALLYLLTGLGLEEQTARQAIARGASAGWISGEKLGRDVRWCLSERGAELVQDIRRRAESLGTLEDVWDGRCLILMVWIPQHQKSVRRRLYNELRWAGFGNPIPGCWASPHPDRAAEIERVIRDLDLEDSTIGFVGETWSVGLTDPEIVRRAYDLDDVAARYEKLLDTFEHLDPNPGDDLLLSYLALVHEWQEFPYMDPQMPKDLLPDWIGRQATEVFLGLRRRWSPGAHERWAEIVEMTAPPSRPSNAAKR